MREYLTKTVRIGDTIAIALPKEALAAEHITENMYVKITITKCRGDHSAAPKESGSSKAEDDPWRLLE